MSTREEIRKRIKFHLDAVYESGLKRSKCDIGFVVDIIVSELHSQGVVIKVDRELPQNPYPITKPTDANHTSYSAVKAFGYEEAQTGMLGAGYVAVEPLMEK